ncbi:MAG: AzlD domain-containing protein [Alphaproteobacteria bacterium]
MSNFGSTFMTILGAGVAANAIWRVAGVALSNGLRETSPVIVWAQSVSKALVAGLVTRLILFPPGALADINLPVRVGAFVLGVAIFYIVRKNSAAGILFGTGALVGMHLLTA